MKEGGAAKGELVLAMYELANSFRHGWGVDKDSVAARSYYETAANLGDIDAMNEVARCYEEGFGGKKDKVSGSTCLAAFFSFLFSLFFFYLIHWQVSLQVFTGIGEKFLGMREEERRKDSNLRAEGGKKGLTRFQFLFPLFFPKARKMGWTLYPWKKSSNSFFIVLRGKDFGCWAAMRFSLPVFANFKADIIFSLFSLPSSRQRNTTDWPKKMEAGLLETRGT